MVKVKFINCKFHGWNTFDYSNATEIKFENITGSALSFRNATLTAAMFNMVNFKKSANYGMYFNFANLKLAHFHLSTLGYSTFENATLDTTHFFGTDLEGVKFGNAACKNSLFHRMNTPKGWYFNTVKSRSMQGCKFSGWDFNNRNLQYFDFTGSAFDNVIFKKANLKGAKLDQVGFKPNCDFEGAIVDLKYKDLLKDKVKNSNKIQWTQ